MMLMIHEEYLCKNLYSYAQNDPINNKDDSGYLVIPRWIISFVVDFLVTLLGIGALFAPIKYAASTLGKSALKKALTPPLSKTIQFLGRNISNVINFFAKMVAKIPLIGSSMRKKIITYIKQRALSTLAGSATSVLVNKLLTAFIPNIDVLLSIGGFLGGLLEVLLDKEGLPLNGKIVV